VTDDRHGLAGLEEMARDAERVPIVADVLRRPASGDDDILREMAVDGDFAAYYDV
jgi:hypothetical protein